MSSIRHSAFGIRHSSPLQVLALLALLAGPATRGRAAEAATPELRLEYALRVWTGARALGRTIGSVIMDFSRETLNGQPARVLRVRTQGSVLGLRVDALSESFMTPDLDRELGFHYLRTGSEQAESRLVFGPNQIEYHKLVHCDAGDACTNPGHQVSAPLHVLNGRPRHCPGCNRPEHGQWRLLCHYPNDPGVRDMFAALYLLRGGALAVGGPSQTTRCVAGLTLWDIGLRALARETVAVPAGSFSTLRIELTPAPANANATGQEFRGPFGLGPDIRLWIDPGQQILVRLVGTAHLTVALQTEMNLVRVTRPQ